jgi:hypothetical protein
MADTDSDSLRKALNLPGEDDLAALDHGLVEYHRAEAQFVYCLLASASAAIFMVVQLAWRFQQPQPLLSTAGIFWFASFAAGIVNRVFSQCEMRLRLGL